MILAIASCYPDLVAEFDSELARLDLTDPAHAVLRDAILLRASEQDSQGNLPPDAAAALEKALSLAHVRIAPPIRRQDDPALARMALAEELAKLSARRGAKAEIEEAMDDLTGLADEGLTWRLARAAEARRLAETAASSKGSEPGEDRAVLSAALQRMIDSEVWVKRRR
jgi:DNA primase